MAEKLTEVLEQYGITAASIVRGRGAFFCREQDRLYKLEPFEGSEGRLLREYEIKERLYHAGFSNIDRYIQVVEQEEEKNVEARGSDNTVPRSEARGTDNTADHLIAADRYRNSYVMKQYFDGHECDLKDEREVALAMENLSELHMVGRQIVKDRMPDLKPKSVDTFIRHNKELKRVRSFISKQNHKNEFERKYLPISMFFISRAQEAEQALKNSLAHENPKRLGLCHGAYHQHNVLIMETGVATVHFEQFHFDNQLTDLYYFTRKLLEKNHYDYEPFKNALLTYEQREALDAQDYTYLYLLFSYPEKFWKLSNHYMNANKAWIPPKMLEKLDNMLQLEGEKDLFLKAFVEDYGIRI